MDAENSFSSKRNSSNSYYLYRKIKSRATHRKTQTAKRQHGERGGGEISPHPTDNPGRENSISSRNILNICPAFSKR